MVGGRLQERDAQGLRRRLSPARQCDRSIVNTSGHTAWVSLHLSCNANVFPSTDERLAAFLEQQHDRREGKDEEPHADSDRRGAEHMAEPRVVDR